MTNMFVILQCQLYVNFHFRIHSWLKWLYCWFAYKAYLLGEKQKIDFTWSDELEIIKAYLCLADKAIHLE